MYLLNKYNRGFMTLFVSPSSDTPIYEQIENQIKTQILSGLLPPLSPLPSMRTLAKDLRVSVITVQKAYENLTRDGFITTGVGRGSFVATVTKEFLRDENLRRAREAAETLVKIAREGGVEKEKVLEIIEECFMEDKDNEYSGDQESGEGL